MKTLCISLISVVLLLSFAWSGHLNAQEKKFELQADYSVKEILKGQEGKRVTISTASGQEFDGVVAKVGDHLVHISSLTGKEFYDAVVPLDQISAIVFRAR
jgi:hypothetical protein